VDGYQQPDADKLQLWEITSAGMTKLQDFADSNMGDAATVKAFMDAVNDIAPAEHMMVIFWDHGEASISGVALDERYGDYLDPLELRQSLQYMKNLCGKNLDLVGFDACLMSNLEVAYLLSDCADYLLGSEEIEPWCGWNYAWLGQISTGFSAKDIAQAVIDTYPVGMLEKMGQPTDTPDPWQAARYTTMSLLDLSQADDLMLSFAQMGTALNDLAKQYPDAHLAALAQIAQKTPASIDTVHLGDLHSFAASILQSLGAYSGDEVYAVYNDTALLGHLNGSEPCQTLCAALAKAAQEVTAACQATVCNMASGPEVKGAGGLSFYTPMLTSGKDYLYETAEQAIELYKQLYAASWEINPGQAETMQGLLDYGEWLDETYLGDKAVLKFRGIMETERKTVAENDWPLNMTVKPASAMKSVADIKLRLSGRERHSPDDEIILYQTTVKDTSTWSEGLVKQQVKSVFYFIKDNDGVEQMITLDRCWAMDNEGLDIHRIPAFIKLEGREKYDTAIFLLVKQSENSEQAKAFAYYYADDLYTAEGEVEPQSRLFYLDRESDFTFCPALLTDFQNWDGWHPQPVEVTLSPADGYALTLLEDQASSGQDYAYSAYFVLTDLAGNTIESPKVDYFLLNSLREMSVVPIPPQMLKEGQACEPEVMLRFMGNPMLEQGEDYKVTYANNTQVGTATATVTTLRPDMQDQEPLTLEFQICTEAEWPKAYIEHIGNLLPEHLPGAEFNDGTSEWDFLPSCLYPYDEYVTHGLLAEEAKMMLATHQADAALAARINAHYAALLASGLDTMNTTANDVEIIGAYNLSQFYEWLLGEPPLESLLFVSGYAGAPQFEPDSAITDANKEQIAQNYAKALAAAQSQNSRARVMQSYNPYYRGQVSDYVAAKYIVNSLVSLPEYDNLTEEEMAELIEQVYDYITANADEDDGLGWLDFSITGDRPEEKAFQPDGMSVVLKFPLEPGYQNNTVSVWRITPYGCEQLPASLITEDGKQYAVVTSNCLIQDDCWFSIFAAPTSSGGGSSHSRPSGTTNTKQDETKTNPEKPNTEKPGSDKPATSTSSDFRDVPASAYYAKAVAWAVANGITNGTDAGVFSPNADCTRGQIAAFLWRAAGQPAPATTANPFSDISPSDYNYQAILWAYENGITTGTSASVFSPDNVCTRAQLVTFLWRAAGAAENGGAAAFQDVADSAYYAQAVAWAVANGVTTGTAENSFSPDTICSRAQAVTFLYRSMAE